jgi:subtilisin family serine protease
MEKLDPGLRGAVRRAAPDLYKPYPWPETDPAGFDIRGEAVYGVLVYTDSADVIRRTGLTVHTELHGVVTMRLTASELQRLARIRAVRYITTGVPDRIMNDVAAGRVGADLVHNGHVNRTAYRGEGVLVCIIDTGIDWSHIDFRDPDDTTKSRIAAIWDQTISASGGESPPTGFAYGVEYSRTHIEDELDGSPEGFVREQDTHGHGTHVAGTAAGNGAALSPAKYGGMAPESDLLIVKAGNGTFFHSDVINGLTWADQKGTELGKPVVVNMSLGSDYGSHDGTDSKSQAIDDFVGSGRVVVVSAGNSGNDVIHFSGTIPASDYTEIFYTVPSYTPAGGSGNDAFSFDSWMDGNGSVTATVYTPAGQYGTRGPEESGVTMVNEGAMLIENYTRSQNGDREITISVYDSDPAVPPATGTWRLRLTNNTASPIPFHGWLYDPHIGSPAKWVTLGGGDSEYTLGNSSAGAIIVGSCVHRWRWSDFMGDTWWGGTPDRSDDLSGFSSHGPTRDERQKPDITAPGDKMASSSSGDAEIDTSVTLPGRKHHVLQGTSMSSPVVAGSVALLLQQNPSLSESGVKSLITGNAVTDGYTGSVWNAEWGYGRLDIYRAMKKAVDPGSTPHREICTYDGWSGDNSASLNPGQKMAIRFTPSQSGWFRGVFVHPSGTVNVTSPLYVEVWSDNGSGLPQTKLGATEDYPAGKLIPFSWHYIDCSGAGVPVSAGTDYHVVVYFTSGGTTYFRLDNGSVDNRSSRDTGGGWAAYTSGDFRFRPVISDGEGVLARIKIFLEGPYDDVSGGMGSALRDGGWFPLTSPYSENPRSVNSIPADVTDWVLIQLRTAPEGAALVSRSALLHSDGRVVADDGATNQIALDAPAGDYYLLVRHRNHLAVMSAAPEPLSTAAGDLYDFTQDPSQAYLSDMALLETGVYGMYAGDANNNGQVQNDDKNDYWRIQVGLAGYRESDFNCNGQVQNDDKNDLWRKNVGKGTQVQ